MLYVVNLLNKPFHSDIHSDLVIYVVYMFVFNREISYMTIWLIVFIFLLLILL